MKIITTTKEISEVRANGKCCILITDQKSFDALWQYDKSMINSVQGKAYHAREFPEPFHFVHDRINHGSYGKEYFASVESTFSKEFTEPTHHFTVQPDIMKDIYKGF